MKTLSKDIKGIETFLDDNNEQIKGIEEVGKSIENFGELIERIPLGEALGSLILTTGNIIYEVGHNAEIIGKDRHSTHNDGKIHGDNKLNSINFDSNRKISSENLDTNISPGSIDKMLNPFLYLYTFTVLKK